MLNLFTVVGYVIHIADDHLVLGVRVPAKGSERSYETNVFNVYYVAPVIGQRLLDHCKIGDTIAIKGSLKSETYTRSNQSYRRIKLIADKITFLKSGAHSRGEEDVEASN